MYSMGEISPEARWKPVGNKGEIALGAEGVLPRG